MNQIHFIKAAMKLIYQNDRILTLNIKYSQNFRTVSNWI